MSTHINAKKGDIANVVLMPGDPLRAKWIAENFLEKAILINDVRGMYGFSGYYKNKKITVMGSGMGIPSIGIYSYELYNFYDVDTIIRVGSAGSIDKKIKVGDVFFAAEAFSYSRYPESMRFKVNKDRILTPTKEILDLLIKTARQFKIPYHCGRVISEDAFYNNTKLEEMSELFHHAQMLEMEAFGLYANAIKYNKKALTIVTCSDSLITKEAMSSMERQTSFKTMVKLALEAAIQIAK